MQKTTTSSSVASKTGGSCKKQQPATSILNFFGKQKENCRMDGRKNVVSLCDDSDSSSSPKTCKRNRAKASSSSIKSFFKSRATSSSSSSVPPTDVISLVDDDIDNVVVIDQQERETKRLKAISDFKKDLARRKELDQKFFSSKTTSASAKSTFFQPSTTTTSKKNRERHDSLTIELTKSWNALEFPTKNHTSSCNRHEAAATEAVVVFPPPGWTSLPCTDAPTVIESSSDVVVTGNISSSLALHNLPEFLCFAGVQKRTISTNIMKDIAAFSDKTTSEIESIVDTLNRMKKLRGSSSSLLLTDIYRPLTQEYCGKNNTHSVSQLQKWLREWKAFSAGDAKKMCYDESLYGEDFESGQKFLHRALVLENSKSYWKCTGKSSFVKAIAESLNYNVIEIGPDIQRSGKAVMKHVGEATQSDRMNISTTNTTSITSPTSKSDKKSRKIKKFRKGKELRAAIARRGGGTSGNNSSSSLTNLIFFEDVDVLFPSFDKGFMTTLSRTMRESKVPIVVTYRQCPADFPTSEEYLRYSLTSPTVNDVLSYVACISALEYNGEMSLEAIRRIVLLTKCDLRACLHWLQFYQKDLEFDCNSLSSSLVFTNYLKCGEFDDITAIPYKTTNASTSSKTRLIRTGTSTTTTTGDDDTDSDDDDILPQSSSSIISSFKWLKDESFKMNDKIDYKKFDDIAELSDLISLADSVPGWKDFDSAISVSSVVRNGIEYYSSSVALNEYFNTIMSEREALKKQQSLKSVWEEYQKYNKRIVTGGCLDFLSEGCRMIKTEKLKNSLKRKRNTSRSCNSGLIMAQALGYNDHALNSLEQFLK